MAGIFLYRRFYIFLVSGFPTAIYTFTGAIMYEYTFEKKHFYSHLKVFG